MAQVNVTEAARLVGKNRKTLYKMMDKGTVAYTQSATGMRQIETSELIRVFGALLSPDVSPSVDKNGHEATGDLSHTVALLEQKIMFLEDKIKDKEERIGDLKATIQRIEYKPAEGAPKAGVWIVLGLALVFTAITAVSISVSMRRENPIPASTAVEPEAPNVLGTVKLPKQPPEPIKSEDH